MFNLKMNYSFHLKVKESSKVLQNVLLLQDILTLKLSLSSNSYVKVEQVNGFSFIVLRIFVLLDSG